MDADSGSAAQGLSSISERRKQVAAIFLKERIMLSPKALSEICASKDPYTDSQQLKEFMLRHGIFVLDDKALSLWKASKSEGTLDDALTAQSTKRPEGWSPRAKSLEAEFSISLDGSDVTDKSKCKGTVKDFVDYFNDRYDRLAVQLKMMATGSRFGRIRDVSSKQGASATVIGMVYSKKMTKNGHLLFEIEDNETLAPVLVPKDAAFLSQAQNIMEDEVVAFDVYSSNALMIAKSFSLPGKMLMQKRKQLINKRASIVFLSDLHIGSRWFLQEQFSRFIDFLNGKGTDEEREVAEDIKYISIGGDLVDGIGVYPRQERELVTKDIYAQYDSLCGFLKQIPEYMQIIMIPGNHDAVRVAEPQPALPLEFVRSAGNMENLHLAGNPSVHKIEGLSLLTYHGSSSDGWVSNHPALRDGYENPQKIAIEMLNCHHLSPRYGEDAVVPEPRDYMIIDSAPDIFHFGHVHKNGYVNDYNGTVIVNSGTFQDQTDFQISMGHQPTPCQVPIYQMNTGELKVLNFMGEKHA